MKLKMKGKVRSSLLQLRSHSWPRTQVHPLAANVAPQPIIFCHVPCIRDILMFKRPPLSPTPCASRSARSSVSVRRHSASSSSPDSQHPRQQPASDAATPSHRGSTSA
jgi:hypothetical protein